MSNLRVENMYKNRLPNGRNNICGENIRRLRQKLPEKTSQRKLADLLQIQGLDIDKNAVQRMESGQRFVTDIELRVLADVFRISCDELLQDSGSD